MPATTMNASERLDDIAVRLAVSETLLLHLTAHIVATTDDPRHAAADLAEDMRDAFAAMPQTAGAQAFRDRALHHVELLEKRLLSMLPRGVTS